MKNQIRTAFIFDFGFIPPDGISREVRGAIVELALVAGLQEGHHLPIQIAYQAEDVSPEFHLTAFDLVVIGYGRMRTREAYRDCLLQLEAACSYAREHRGCLLVIWTGLTAEMFQDELVDGYGQLENIVCRYRDSTYVDQELDGTIEFREKLRKSFADGIQDALQPRD